MQHRGCKPDAVTFGGLIAAYDRAGLWRRALTAFEAMKAHNCRPDSVVYNTVVGSLWATGLVWAQAKATQIFHAACRQGHFRLTVHTLDAGGASVTAVGSPQAHASPASATSTAMAAAAAALLPQALPAAAGMARAGSGSGSGSRSGSPSLSLPQAISLGLSGGSSRQDSGGLATPDLLSPATCGTPLSALAAACGSPSPRGSPVTEGSLAAAAAALAGTGTGAGTLIEFGMHAFTVGSAVLSLLRWVAELRERLPREPNKDLKQQVGAGWLWALPGCWLLDKPARAAHFLVMPGCSVKPSSAFLSSQRPSLKCPSLRHTHPLPATSRCAWC